MMYVVQSFEGNNFYTSSLNEACQHSNFVQLLMGKPGHFETVKQSW